MSDGTTGASDIPENANFLFAGLEDVESTPEAQPPDETQGAGESAPGGGGDSAPESNVEQAGAPAVPPAADDRAFKGVLSELRDTRRELRMQREEAARLRAEQEARLRQATTPPPPNKDEDPAAWLAYENRMAVEQLRREFEAKEQARQYQEQTAQIRQQFYTTVTSLEDEVRAQAPDYDEAVQYISTLREYELSAMGVPEEEIPGIVAEEKIQFTAMHLRNGQSPAQQAYAYALARGFRGGVPANAQNGQQAAPAAPRPTGMARPPQTTPTVARSLSATSGGSGGRKVTLENLTSFDHATQNAIMDNEEAWATINQGGAWYA